MRVVLDTNIKVSAIGWKGNPRKILQLGIDGKITLLESLETLNELQEVLYRDKFDFIPSDKKLSILRILVELSEIIKPEIKLEVIKDDPDDNKFLECAIAGNANYLISGDKHLLKLKYFRGIKILSAKEFLDLIEAIVG
ncbi:MAG: putative toxin-antitoxin system toxin component, PIN family [Methanosarcinales archaeon]